MLVEPRGAEVRCGGIIDWKHGLYDMFLFEGGLSANSYQQVI